MSGSDNRKSYEDHFRYAVELADNGDIPYIYFNEFTNALGTGDVTIIARRNGKPASVINIPFTVAKTLGETLSKIINDFETETGNTIMTTKQIETILTAQDDNNDDKKDES